MVLKPLSPCPLDEFSESLSLRYKYSKSWKKSTKRAAKSDFFRRFNCCEPCLDNISDKTYDKWLFILYPI